MGAAYDRITNALTNTTGYTPPGGHGNWRCPAHPDNNPSLNVTNGGDRALITCHAGCPPDTILAALNLTRADLFDQPKTGARPQKTIAAEYDYTDEHGTLLYQVVRYQPKGFGQRQPDGHGGWTWNMNGVRRVLYRLPQILAAIADGAPTFLVEGEKDVHALEQAGETATTPPGGAGKWRPEYTETLRGAHIIIVADNDPPGRAHANTVHQALTGIAATIETRLPAHGHKDIADHLGAGLNLAELQPTTSTTTQNAETDTEPTDRLGITPINWPAFWAQETPDEQWLAQPVIPDGRQVAIFSAAKTGKSLLALEIAAALATGRATLNQPAGPPTNIVYIDMEMTEEDLRERLEDLGYGPDNNLDHLHYYLLSSLPPLDTELGGETLLAIVNHHQARLVVLDTMARVVHGEENSADTYRDFYRHTGRRLKAAHISLLRLDHAGKDGVRGQRGSSSKDDDLDVVFRMTIVDNIVTLHRTRTRIPWVPAEIILTRHTDPNVAHQATAEAWPAGTQETADLLDQTNIPLDATLSTALADLRKAGHGKRRLVVAAALKYRRKPR